MLEELASFLEGRLSHQGRLLLRVLLALLICGLMLYFLNYLRLNYLGSLSNAVNAVE
jgi:hypothetical protein